MSETEFGIFLYKLKYDYIAEWAGHLGVGEVWTDLLTEYLRTLPDA